MQKKTKMNGLYKTGFILLMVSVCVFIAAIITAYLFERVKLSSLLSAGGAFLCLLGIISVMFSKPKKDKPAKTALKEQSEKSVDNLETI